MSSVNRFEKKTLRIAREQQNLSEEFCAANCGLSIEEYGDVESHDTEFFDNISMGTARRICWILRLDLLGLVSQFLGISMSENMPTNDIAFFARHNLVSTARLNKGLSASNLANLIGFDRTTIEMLERSSDFVESLPIKVVVSIANALDIHPILLICRRSAPNP